MADEICKSCREDPCPTNGGREKNGNWSCPGGIPIRDERVSTGWSCWWCGGVCDPPKGLLTAFTRGKGEVVRKVLDPRASGASGVKLQVETVEDKDAIIADLRSRLDYAMRFHGDEYTNRVALEAKVAELERKMESMQTPPKCEDPDPLVDDYVNPMNPVSLPPNPLF